MRIMAVIVLGVCLPISGFPQGQQPVNVEDQGAGKCGLGESNEI
jgi:hypothetical protein